MLVMTFGAAIVVVIVTTVFEVVFLNGSDNGPGSGSNSGALGSIATGGFGNNGTGNGASDGFFGNVIGLCGHR